MGGKNKVSISRWEKGYSHSSGAGKVYGFSIVSNGSAPYVESLEIAESIGETNSWRTFKSGAERDGYLQLLAGKVRLKFLDFLPSPMSSGDGFATCCVKSFPDIPREETRCYAIDPIAASLE